MLNILNYFSKIYEEHKIAKNLASLCKIIKIYLREFIKDIQIIHYPIIIYESNKFIYELQIRVQKIHDQQINNSICKLIYLFELLIQKTKNNDNIEIIKDVIMRLINLSTYLSKKL